MSMTDEHTELITTPFMNGEKPPMRTVYGSARDETSTQTDDDGSVPSLADIDDDCKPVFKERTGDTIS
jgi:hypothetical protein